ncbi:hypothetical protein PCE1_001416 [Barthelona sp. PCE]
MQAIDTAQEVSFTQQDARQRKAMLEGFYDFTMFNEDDTQSALAMAIPSRAQVVPLGKQFALLPSRTHETALCTDIFEQTIRPFQSVSNTDRLVEIERRALTFRNVYQKLLPEIELLDPCRNVSKEIHTYGLVFQTGDEINTIDSYYLVVLTEMQNVQRIGNFLTNNNDRSIISLNFSDKLPGYALFSGCFVVLKGIFNLSTFLVNDIIRAPIPQTPKLPPSIVSSLNTQLPHRMFYNEQNLQIFVAAGPYSSNSSPFDFLYFNKFLQQVANHVPDCLVLMGPFLPDKSFLKNRPETFPNVLFFDNFLKQLIDFRRAIPTCNVLIVPHRDCILTNRLYPCPPLQLLPNSYIDQNKRLQTQGKAPIAVNPLHYLHSLPAPAKFWLNDMLMYITGDDALRHIAKTEVCSYKGDRTQRLLAHLLTQRHLSPTFPNNALCVPDKYMGFSVAPHIMLTCSVLPTSTYALDNSIAVSVQSLNRKSFCSISIFPNTGTAPIDTGKRCNVQFLKLKV